MLADDYPSLQAALDAAVSSDLPIVRLNPASIYTLTETLAIPEGVTLDGYARGFGATRGAVLRADAALNPMLQFGHNASLIGCHVDGNNTAIVGALIQSNFVTLERNRFTNFANINGAAIRAGGALYTVLKHNQISQANGYALEALQAYKAEPSAYYGINHGLSEGNVYGGKMGSVVEGMFSSYNDDFELQLNGQAAITIGGTVQSQLNLVNAYFELIKGTAPLCAVCVENSARLTMTGCEVFGAAVEAERLDSVAIQANVAYQLNVSGNLILRWQDAIAGSLVNGAAILIGGNRIQESVSHNALTNTENATIAVMETG